MRVSTRLMLSLFILMGCFMGGMVMVRGWQSRNIDFVLKNRQREIEQLSEKTVDLMGRSLYAFSYDYTNRDEMVQFAQTGDAEWARENLDTSLVTYGAHAVWVYRPDFSLVYCAKMFTDDSVRNLPVPAGAIKEMFTHARLVHFFVDSPYGLMEIRGATIHPSNDAGRRTSPQGYFFVGRLWDRAYLKEVSELLNGQAAIVPWQPSNRRPSEEIRERGESIFMHALRGWDGKMLAHLEVQSFAPMLKQFVLDWNWGLVFGSIISVLLVGVFSILAIRWIAVPLQKVSASLTAGNPAAVRDLERSKSEFGLIARLIEEDYRKDQELIKEIAARKAAEENLIDLRDALALRVQELEEAAAHIKTLQGILPVCMYCHKIRDDQQSWQELERYILHHTDAQFSHGLCPECAKKHYPDLKLT